MMNLISVSAINDKKKDDICSGTGFILHTRPLFGVQSNVWPRSFSRPVMSSL